MSGSAAHSSGSRALTAVLGAILLVAEIPIRVMEHLHFLHGVETQFPQFYAFLFSPTGTVARWIVGVLMILWVIVESRKEPAAQPALAAQQLAPQPQPFINFSPIIQNIQHPVPIGVAAEAAQPARVEQQPQVPAPQPGPNLIFVQARIAPVTLDNTPDRQFFYESRIEDRDDPRAVLACFRNELVDGRAGIDLENVRAQVIYRNQAGQEIGLAILGACWLNEFGDMVDFPVGDTHCAVLITRRADGQLLMPWHRRRRAPDGGGDVLNFQIQAVNEEISTIEVRLRDNEHGKRLTKTEFQCSRIVHTCSRGLH